jgi:3-oxosteroid 1-dehydrogenase
VRAPAGPQRSTIDCDLAVVGSGAAGLTAALAAADRGARVVVLEKSALLGGTTAMSGGCVWVPCHHRMAEIGASDSAEEALDYIRAVSPEGWHNLEEPLWAAFVDEAPRMLRFLEAKTPLRFQVNREPDPYAEAPGGKAFGRNVSAGPLSPRLLGRYRRALREPTLKVPLNYEEIVDSHLYADPRKHALRFGPRILWRRLFDLRTRGAALSIGLLKGCLDAGCRLMTGTAAESLALEGGRVAGLRAKRDGAELEVRARRGVVLASGGFEWNEEMMAEYLPGPREWTASPSTNTGDGQRMAAAVGARLDRMDQALVMGTQPILYEGRLQGLPAADYFLPHSMLVNRLGQRFVNEKQMNVGLAFAARDPATGWPVNLPAWRIYDGQFAAKYPHALPKKTFEGVRFEAPTLAELAEKIGVDAAGLVETAKRFSAFAHAGRDDDFGRGASLWDRARGGDPAHKPSPTLGSIERPPFYAMPFKASYLGTKGGARTNQRGQVVNLEGEPIPGLYAAGNVMANAFGSKGVGAGTTLGPCLTWGYICGRSAMAD